MAAERVAATSCEGVGGESGCGEGGSGNGEGGEGGGGEGGGEGPRAAATTVQRLAA